MPYWLLAEKDKVAVSAVEMGSSEGTDLVMKALAHFRDDCPLSGCHDLWYSMMYEALVKLNVIGSLVLLKTRRRTLRSQYFTK